MTTTRSGSTQKYAINWSAAFGEKKSTASKPATSNGAKAAKKVAKKPAAKKGASKSKTAKR
jgi:hypothetical protein